MGRVPLPFPPRGSDAVRKYRATMEKYEREMRAVDARHRREDWLMAALFVLVALLAWWR